MILPGLRSFNAAVACFLVMSFGCTSEIETDDALTLLPCHVDRYRQEVLCGTHTVFENRQEARGRQIEIHVVVIPAIGETAMPDPMVILAGGPGQGAIGLAPVVDVALSKVNEDRDIVLIDQRGVGSSHPLECETPDETALLLLGREERQLLDREQLVECLSRIDADVTLYTQDLANADIHEITRALGYRSINLYGGSWGTRSALLYAHQYPDQVRTIVLDGNLPLSNRAPTHAAADGDRAIEKLFDDCQSDPSCQGTFGNLKADFEQALGFIGSGGVTLVGDDPTTGETQSFLLSQDDFGGTVFGILYSAELSRLLPLIIHQAASGNFETLIAVSSYLEAGLGPDPLNRGVNLTILCSEDLARRSSDSTTSTAGRKPSLLGYGLLDATENACSVWPQAVLPTIYAEDIRPTVPALILSGDLDPITPPRWGEAISQALPNSMHVVAAATGHGVLAVGCAPDLIHQLVDQGDLEGIDGSCLSDLTRPSFFLGPSGPSSGAGQNSHD